MTLDYAKKEISRLLGKGLEKSDVACLVASWGLSMTDMEAANQYIHDAKINEPEYF